MQITKPVQPLCHLQKQHWQSTTLTAPGQRLNQKNPRSAARAIYTALIYNPNVRCSRRR